MHYRSCLWSIGARALGPTLFLVLAVMATNCLGARGELKREGQRSETRGVIASTTDATAVSETAPSRDRRMAWWRNARFGMFVHWGLYAIPAGEWDGKIWTRGGMEWIQKRANVSADEYEKRLVPQFKPKAGFAKQWAQLAKQAGCKYVVFTTKHHDGFALHDSAVSTFDAKDACGRDLCKEIVDAVRGEGLRVGMYHSLWDWHHPQAYAGKNTNNPSCQTMEGRDPKIYIDYLHAQVKELVTGYGPVDVMWFDYSSPRIQGPAWRAQELMKTVREAQPNIIINNRLYRSTKAGWASNGKNKHQQMDTRYGDFTTPEQKIPATGSPGVDWETCMTMNTTWGYSKHDHAWKSSKTLIRNLIDIASKGGNYLLNIGPKADGTIPEESVQRMHDIGKWMAVNGESIYGTVANSFKETPWGRCTRKKLVDGRTRLYLHVFEWPADGKLKIADVPGDPAKAYLLADPAKTPVPFQVSAKQTTLVLPSKAPDSIASVVVLDVNAK